MPYILFSSQNYTRYGIYLVRFSSTYSRGQTNVWSESGYSRVRERIRKSREKERLCPAGYNKDLRGRYRISSEESGQRVVASHEKFCAAAGWEIWTSDTSVMLPSHALYLPCSTLDANFTHWTCFFLPYRLPASLRFHTIHARYNESCHGSNRLCSFVRWRPILPFHLVRPLDNVFISLAFEDYFTHKDWERN